jgi:hypothetical protein
MLLSELMLVSIELITHNRSSDDMFYSGNFVYCGTDVMGWPQKIDDDIVTFRYARSEASEKSIEIPLYMLKKGEMKKILQDAEFDNIQEYSDFKPGLFEDADFFTYIAHKLHL